MHVLRAIWKMSSADFSSPGAPRAKTDCWSPAEGWIFRHHSLVANTADTWCVRRFIINELLASHSLPPVCHAPVWVLDIVAVAVVCAVLAGLARKVHLDGADVGKQGAPDIGSWQPKGDLVPAKIRSLRQALIHMNFNGQLLIRLMQLWHVLARWSGNRQLRGHWVEQRRDRGTGSSFLTAGDVSWL